MRDADSDGCPRLALQAPAQILAAPVAGSTRSTPVKSERSSSVPSVAHSGAKECPAPATRTVIPCHAAAITVFQSSSREARVSTTRGVARTFPAQFDHASAAVLPVTLPPRPKRQTDAITLSCAWTLAPHTSGLVVGERRDGVATVYAGGGESTRSCHARPATVNWSLLHRGPVVHR